MEQPAGHVHHLALFRLAVPHHRLLDLGGGVFVDGQPQFGRGHQDHPPGLGHANAGGDVGVEEKLLNGHNVRGKLVDEGLQILLDLHQALGHGNPCRGVDGPAAHQACLAPLGLQDPKPHNGIPRVNAENPHGALLVPRK